MTEQTFQAVIVFLTGLIFGSFFNVCIFRIPTKRSIMFPNSFCPKCKKPIEWYDNIPVLSYFLLKGKCRNCSTAISFRYPLVEALTGLLFLLLYLNFGVSFALLRGVILTGFLIIIGFIDFDTQYIFEATTIPLVLAGLFLSLLPGGNPWNSLLGVITGAGILYIIGMASIILFKKEGMGGGDVYLAGAIGAFLGWKGAIAMLFVSFMIGALISLVLIGFKVLNRKAMIPFGPYIAASALAVLFLGDKLIYLAMPLLPRN